MSEITKYARVNAPQRQDGILYGVFRPQTKAHLRAFLIGLSDGIDVDPNTEDLTFGMSYDDLDIQDAYDCGLNIGQSIAVNLPMIADAMRVDVRFQKETWEEGNYPGVPDYEEAP